MTLNELDIDETKEMPDIPDVPPEIMKAAARGRLVVFMGAGLSRIIGCPSWKEFALLQLRDLLEKKAINYYEYNNLKMLDARKLLSICRNIYVENNIPPGNMKSFLRGDDKLIRRYKTYEELYKFNAIYVTTNYDDYLDKIAQKTLPQNPTSTLPMPAASIVPDSADFSQRKVIHKKDELLISNLDNGTVIHLHGSVKDEGNTIVTIVDYMKHYEHQSKPAVLLEEIFGSFTVLFIGYGLEEYEILEFMIRESQIGKNEIKHFMLYPVFKKETNLLKFQKRYYADLGVSLIPYPIDEVGYGHLAEVIQKWAEQIGPVSKPQGFMEKVRMIDEVI
jgi:hypothetical protein